MEQVTDMASPIGAVERPTTLYLTPDPFSSAVTPSPVETGEFERRHVIEIVKEHGNRDAKVAEILRQSVAEELSKLGVEYEVVRNKSTKTRKSPRPKDSNKSDSSNGLNRTVEVQLKPCGRTVTIPFIVQKTCEFIRQHVKQQGIFRISGVASRANGIMQRFTNPEIEDYFVVCDTVHDVSSVLKQYLREREVPLIPYAIQHVFTQCLDLQPESICNEALLLATCLVPAETIGCLTYILQFLSEVAESRLDNLMTFENLSIIMGLNIMPIDPRKNDKAKDQKTERQVLDRHNKVVEILMKNADRVGEITPEVEKRLDSLFSLRSSEDELENEGGGRRKKRRSGSLNRMFGFLKKVTSGKGETPATPMPHTPRGDSFSYTPIIKGSMKRSDDGVFSLRKKKNIFDGVRKSTKNETGTPSTPLPNKIVCPSPAICLDPSPMRVDWKQTPNGNRLKNFVTPGLLRKKDRSADSTSDKNVFSVPSSKQSKSKIRFGRSKTIKKQQGTPPQDLQLLKSKQCSSSTVSIHKLAKSPRSGTLQRCNASTRIPRPDKPALPPKRLNSSTLKLRSHSSKSSLNKNSAGEGDYVIISASAGLNDADVRNDAFIASSISILTESEASELPQQTSVNASNTIQDISVRGNESIDTEDPVDIPPKLGLELSPLIREIDSLTKTAQELTLSTVRGKSTSSIRSTESRTLTLSESPTEMDTTPLCADQVETKFIRAMKESKIIEIQSEMKDLNSPINNLQRRLSIQDRKSRLSMSPSQRKINSARRRTHEIGRVTSVVTPTRFRSLRSPRQQEVYSPSGRTDYNSLKRSPNRCTLRRGRPNTTRVGLARPSPVRNTPRSVISPVDSRRLSRGEDEEMPEPPPPLPPRQDSKNVNPSPSPRNLTRTLRRMSSVQELVNKLEIHKKNHSQSEVSSRSIDLEPTIAPQIIITRSQTKNGFDNKSRRASKSPNFDRNPQQEGDNEVNWISAHKFKFDRKDLNGVRKTSDRDSIHFLKTLGAGKVPATVEYFNKIGHSRSPGKSLIPRYTALHNKKGSKISTPENSSPRLPGGGVDDHHQGSATPNRISRRISSVDIDIRRKHEERLESIKKERAVKRSATTVGTYHNHNTRRNISKGNEGPTLSKNFKRPNTLNFGKNNESPSSSASKPLPKPGITSKTPSFRRTSQTPRILEEDESAVLSVDNETPKEKCDTSCIKSGKKPGSITTSPLKKSNIANLSFLPPKDSSAAKKSPFKVSPPIKGGNYNMRKRNVTISRTASEIGTKSTSTTPRTTPKIKKALTTRAYDMINSTTNTPLSPKTITTTPRRTPSGRTPLSYQSSVSRTGSQSHARHCPTITPRRRVPRMGNGGGNTTVYSENGHRTPMKAKHMFTPSQ